jgi:hypothetical protein
MFRRAIPTALAVAVLAMTWSASPAANPPTAAASGCVKFSATQFNGPGNDNYELLEWVRIKNVCATRKAIGGWKIYDYGRIHVYTFASGVHIGPGKTITLWSGTGSNTTTKRYWGRTYGAVWNDVPTEYAYLKNGAGAVVSRVTEY